MTTSACDVMFPGLWVNAYHFERALSGHKPHGQAVRAASFTFPPSCKIMVDAGVRLLSLVNQLCAAKKKVLLTFDEGILGTMGYLNRMGFFDFLDPAIEVAPFRPRVPGAGLFGGRSASLVEFAAIAPRERDQGLPGRLAQTLEDSVGQRPDARTLGHAAFTVFAELIDNIHNHSGSTLAGYAALQVYKKGGRVKVVVSDSGVGILNTLRPVMAAMRPMLAEYSDTDLVVEAFRKGLSRHGGGRGCGLKTCADHALKFSAELDVRLPNCRVHLLPSSDGYKPNLALCSDGLFTLHGTHLAFDFALDK